MTGFLVRPVRSTAMRYAIAVGSVVLALLARVVLNPLLGDQLPFATFFAAVALSVWAGGWKPSLLTMVIGFVAAELFCIRPPGWVA